MSDKICPLMAVMNFEHECFQERCAWWDVEYEKCAVLTFSYHFSRVADKIGLTRD
jgi:hypothetical protein